jgi:hypothetical protein
VRHHPTSPANRHRSQEITATGHIHHTAFASLRLDKHDDILGGERKKRGKEARDMSANIPALSCAAHVCCWCLQSQVIATVYNHVKLKIEMKGYGLQMHHLNEKPLSQLIDLTETWLKVNDDAFNSIALEVSILPSFGYLHCSRP